MERRVLTWWPPHTLLPEANVDAPAGDSGVLTTASCVQRAPRSTHLCHSASLGARDGNPGAISLCICSFCCILSRHLQRGPSFLDLTVPAHSAPPCPWLDPTFLPLLPSMKQLCSCPTSPHVHPPPGRVELLPGSLVSGPPGHPPGPRPVRQCAGSPPPSPSTSLLVCCPRNVSPPTSANTRAVPAEAGRHPSWRFGGKFKGGRASDFPIPDSPEILATSELSFKGQGN